MKKLVLAALVACSMSLMADEAAKPAAVAPEAAKVVRPRPGKMTPEQRAALRAKRDKVMAERKAAMEKKAIEVIKKYGLDDAKAKALFDELQSSLTGGFGRRPRPNVKVPAAKAE